MLMNILEQLIRAPIVSGINEGTVKTLNPKCRLYWGFNRVYRVEIKSVMLIFSAPLVNYCPSTFSLTSPTPPPPLPKVNVLYSIYRQCGCGGMGGGVELC
jgi:hypothetical protein